MLVYVLTEEPYHENSSVLGAFTDAKEAVDALLAAPKLPPKNKDDEPDTWELVAFEGKTEHRRLYILAEDRGDSHLAGKVYHQPVRYDWETRHEVDPYTFDWRKG